MMFVVSSGIDFSSAIVMLQTLWKRLIPWQHYY